MQKLTSKSHKGCGGDHGLSLEAASERLKAAGYKLTKPRLAILKTISRQHGPFTTEELFQAARGSASRGTKLDLVTVYRSLTTFENMNLLTRIDLGDGRVRYEAREESGQHHHHFICRACDKVEPLRDCEIKRQEDVLARAGYTHLTHRLEFFGLCPACSK